ncbi:hypothetical protein H2200_004746 [Cladophialophora chaetospira]|uniref:Uncharacterized protein n=1 Tax=Cladophialophora chaetospira TaxID=386627 RepID=A0AA38XDR6_9EURO|nr:hypothetical protein H2200_004746 [Cladophialophora chaetospira]
MPTDTPTRPIDLQEATRLSTVFVDRIFEAWTKLNEIVPNREALIRKKWRKKTKQRREKVLREAWPNIPQGHASHLPILLAALQERSISSEEVGTLRWPNINLEDLVQPELLATYLGSRARNLPHVFAHEDQHTVLAARSAGAFEPISLPDCTMLLIGQATRETYGRILSFEDDMNATTSTSTESILTPD